MPILEVLRFPDPRLRKVARPVKRVNGDVRRLAHDMLETMYAEGGIGLAAIQVNVQQRVVVMDLSPDRSAPMIFINPEILLTEGTTEGQEGCLSVPGYYDTVKRASQVRFRYLDIEGNAVVEDADELKAICLQHEIDHLDGRLFIDYLSPLKRRRLRKKSEKLEKQLAPAL
jgi:peptide deformylase